MTDVVVVGGGIAGLAAADRLAAAGVRVTLLEAADRLGGHDPHRPVRRPRARSGRRGARHPRAPAAVELCARARARPRISSPRPPRARCLDAARPAAAARGRACRDLSAGARTVRSRLLSPLGCCAAVATSSRPRARQTATSRSARSSARGSAGRRSSGSSTRCSAASTAAAATRSARRRSRRTRSRAGGRATGSSAGSAPARAAPTGPPSRRSAAGSERCRRARARTPAGRRRHAARSGRDRRDSAPRAGRRDVVARATETRSWPTHASSPPRRCRQRHSDAFGARPPPPSSRASSYAPAAVVALAYPPTRSRGCPDGTGFVTAGGSAGSSAPARGRPPSGSTSRGEPAIAEGVRRRAPARPPPAAADGELAQAVEARARAGARHSAPAPVDCASGVSARRSRSTPSAISSASTRVEAALPRADRGRGRRRTGAPASPPACVPAEAAAERLLERLGRITRRSPRSRS